MDKLECIILDIYWKLTFLGTIVEGGQKIDKLEVNYNMDKIGHHLKIRTNWILQTKLIIVNKIGKNGRNW